MPLIPLLWSFAVASAPPVYDTKIGPITPSEAQAICSAPNAIVGKVTSTKHVTQVWKGPMGGKGGTEPAMDVTVTVLRRIVGEETHPTVTFRVLGTYRPEEGVNTVDDIYIQPKIGWIYGIAFERVEGQPFEEYPPNLPLPVFQIWIPPEHEAAIPSTRRLSRRLTAFCSSLRSLE